MKAKKRMDLSILRDTPPWEWPADAARMFQDVLTHQKDPPSDRMLAAELAGDIPAMTDGLAAALMAVLENRDEPESLRAQAAISLGPVLELGDTHGFDDPEDVPVTEDTFDRIVDLLEKIYLEPGVPKEVRRRILEASVRAPRPWHRNAIQEAYSSRDREWVLTAVFAMKYVRGFEQQILESLHNPDPEIHLEAVGAAGEWCLDGAWDHLAELATNPRTPKPLRIEAISALGSVRPAQTAEILDDLLDSHDEEIAEAASEAISMAQMETSEGDEDEDEDEDEDPGGEWIN
jgi:hypothetical protein